VNTDETKVVVVPCSGIGKPFGTVSREAVLREYAAYCQRETKP